MSATYAIAYNVKGFRGRKSIRVRVERVEGSYAWVRTADVADAGTPLVLDVSQLEYEMEWPEDEVRHKDGLVGIG